MLFLSCLAGAIVGAFGNRIRGGLLPIPGGTQVGRLVGWGLPMAALAWPLGWWALAVGAGAFLGCCVGQFGGLSMGHRGPGPAVSPWLTMTVWGLARVAGPVAILLMLHHPAGAALVLVSGLACAPLYDLAWRVPPWIYVKGLGYGDGPATGYDPPELAEALHGALMGLALALAVR